MAKRTTKTAPSKAKATATTKAAAKKPVAKKPVAKKPAAKVPAKKAPAKKAVAKKTPVKKTVAKTTTKTVAAAKKAPAKKPAAKVTAQQKIAKELYGQRVRELRLSCGLTQSDLSRALGVTPGYISNVENNRTAMSLHILIYFAQLTGQTLDSLVGTLEPAYKMSALDKKIDQLVRKLSTSDKEKLVKTLTIWSKK